MKRYLAVILASIVAVGLAIPTLGLTYKYQIPVSVVENGTANYPNGVALTLTINNTALQNALYINSSANNTRFSTSYHMPVSDRVTYYVPTLGVGSSNIYYYYLGSDTQLASFPIIPGYGGNVTVANAANLALLLNFSASYIGYVDTTQNTSFWNQPGSYNLTTSSNGSVSATFNASFNQSTQSASVNTSQTLSINITTGGVGNYTNIDLGAAPHWRSVLPTVATGVATESAVQLKDMYSLNATQVAAVSASLNITSISVYMMYTRNNNGGANEYFQGFLRIGATETSGTNHGYITGPQSFTDVIARPGGGSWTVADLSNLQMGIGLTGLGGGAGSAECDVLVLQINYISTDATRVGEQLSVSPNTTISQVSLLLKKVGSPTGTANITVRNGSNDTIIATVGTQNIALLTTSYAWYSYNVTANVNVANIRVLFEVALLDQTNYVQIGLCIADNLTGGNFTQYIAPSYTSNSSTDLTLAIKYVSTITGTATSGSANITASLNNSVLSLLRDSVLLTSAGFPGSVTSNTSNITLMSDSPYATNITLSTNGTPRFQYTPNTIILGTNLPNRVSSSYNGTFNWGTNPIGISTNTSAMVTLSSSSAPSNPTVGSHNLPNINLQDPNTETSVGANAGGLYELVLFLHDVTLVDTVVIWYPIVIGIALLSGVGTMIAVSVVLKNAPVVFTFGAGLTVLCMILFVFAYSIGVIDKFTPIITLLTSLGLFIAVQRGSMMGTGGYL